MFCQTKLMVYKFVIDSLTRGGGTCQNSYVLEGKNLILRIKIFLFYIERLFLQR